MTGTLVLLLACLFHFPSQRPALAAEPADTDAVFEKETPQSLEKKILLLDYPLPQAAKILSRCLEKKDLAPEFRELPWKSLKGPVRLAVVAGGVLLKHRPQDAEQMLKPLHVQIQVPILTNWAKMAKEDAPFEYLRAHAQDDVKAGFIEAMSNSARLTEEEIAFVRAMAAQSQSPATRRAALVELSRSSELGEDHTQKIRTLISSKSSEDQTAGIVAALLQRNKPLRTYALNTLDVTDNKEVPFQVIPKIFQWGDWESQKTLMELPGTKADARRYFARRLMETPADLNTPMGLNYLAYAAKIRRDVRNPMNQTEKSTLQNMTAIMNRTNLDEARSAVSGQNAEQRPDLKLLVEELINDTRHQTRKDETAGVLRAWAGISAPGTRLRVPLPASLKDEDYKSRVRALRALAAPQRLEQARWDQIYELLLQERNDEVRLLALRILHSKHQNDPRFQEFVWAQLKSSNRELADKAQETASELYPADPKTFMKLIDLLNSTQEDAIDSLSKRISQMEYESVISNLDSKDLVSMSKTLQTNLFKVKSGIKRASFMQMLIAAKNAGLESSHFDLRELIRHAPPENMRTKSILPLARLLIEGNPELEAEIRGLRDSSGVEREVARSLFRYQSKPKEVSVVAAPEPKPVEPIAATEQHKLELLEEVDTASRNKNRRAEIFNTLLQLAADSSEAVRKKALKILPRFNTDEFRPQVNAALATALRQNESLELKVLAADAIIESLGTRRDETSRSLRSEALDTKINCRQRFPHLVPAGR